MSSDPPPPPPAEKPRLSLYGSHDPPTNKSGAVISAEPVLYKQEAKDEDKVRTAFPMAQPVRRPQASQKPKAKTKLGFAFPTKLASSPPNAAEGAPPQAPARPKYQDFVGDEDDMDFVMSNRPRPKKKSKKDKDEEANQPVDWNQVYEYNRPNDFHEYHTSEDRYRMIRVFHRLVRQDAQPSVDTVNDVPANPAAVPVASLTFAPPSSLEPMSNTRASPVQPPSSALPDAATGEDAYMNRLRASHGIQASSAQDIPPPPPPVESPPPPPPPPPPSQVVKPQPAVISAEPIRYNVPSTSAPAPEQGELPTAVDGGRPKKPLNKALQMMLKMGHVQGKGLGAKQDGIVKPLSLQQEKRKRLPDSQGGGFAAPAIGRIVGGTKAKGSQDEEQSKFGDPSNVVMILGLAEGVDFEAESQRDDGGIRQRLGDWLTEKFGNVERLIVYEQTTGDQVPIFVKFTDGFSAMRAVSSFDSLNFQFEGKSGVARYYEEEKFEKGIYE